MELHPRPLPEAASLRNLYQLGLDQTANLDTLEGGEYTALFINIGNSSAAKPLNN